MHMYENTGLAKVARHSTRVERALCAIGDVGGGEYHDAAAASTHIQYENGREERARECALIAGTCRASLRVFSCCVT